MLSGAGVLSGFRPKGPAEHSGGLRGLKAVTDTQGITVRKPLSLCRSPLRGPYGADTFAHFDTKKFGAHPDRPNLPGLLLLAASWMARIVCPQYSATIAMKVRSLDRARSKTAVND